MTNERLKTLLQNSVQMIADEYYNQNVDIFGIVNKIKTEIGFTNDELHEILPDMTEEYSSSTSIWEKLSDAESKGITSIQNKYDELFARFKDAQDEKQVILLAITLNHKAVAMKTSYPNYSKLYKQLYLEVDEFITTNFTDADIVDYYLKKA